MLGLCGSIWSDCLKTSFTVQQITCVISVDTQSAFKMHKPPPLVLRNGNVGTTGKELAQHRCKALHAAYVQYKRAQHLLEIILLR